MLIAYIPMRSHNKELANKLMHKMAHELAFNFGHTLKDVATIIASAGH
jgi:hypothetical protein